VETKTVAGNGSRAVANGDQVSYHRRMYKVTTVWGGQMEGYVSIMRSGGNPGDSGGTTIKAERLVWSDKRWGGCWIVMKS
jgi:hypothetical protein